MGGIRGLYIGRPALAGGITFSLFLFRAVYTYNKHPVIEFFNDPIVVFLCFLVAGVVMTYPYMKGWKAIVITPLMVALMLFFVYTYYIL